MNRDWPRGASTPDGVVPRPCTRRRRLEELLRVPPKRRRPGNIADMLRAVEQGPLEPLFRRFSPLTRATIMERASLATFETGSPVYEQVREQGQPRTSDAHGTRADAPHPTPASHDCDAPCAQLVQGDLPNGWWVVIGGNATLFHKAGRQQAAELGAVFIDDYTSSSSSDSDVEPAFTAAASATPTSYQGRGAPRHAGFQAGVTGAVVAAAKFRQPVPARMTRAYAMRRRWGRQRAFMTAGDSFGAEEILGNKPSK